MRNGGRALLRPCVVVQTALTEHLVGLSEGQSGSDSLIDEIIECAFSGLYKELLLEPPDQ